MRLEFRYPAPWGTVFDRNAADGLIGKPFTAKVGAMPVGEGTVVSASAVDGGTALLLVVEWPS